jgi:hypothetical protein
MPLLGTVNGFGLAKGRFAKEGQKQNKKGRPQCDL